MTRPRPIPTVIAAAAVLFTIWVARNTYWAEVPVPMPWKGEALTNPFYVAQRFAEALGARTSWDREFTVPPADAVVVLSSWHWDLSRPRREALEQWVRAGGRLVVDATLADASGEFERWSGVAWRYQEEDETDETAPEEPEDPCRTFQEEQHGVPASGPSAAYRLCYVDTSSWLESGNAVVWALRDRTRRQAIRVEMGRGTVTAINASPFTHRDLLQGDNARLLVAAAELRPGDDVHFLSEDEHPSLVALVWRHGAAVAELTLALLALVLWRGSARFGPPAPPVHSARRSLAEQIRGTGEFALRYDSDHSLHAACVRALDEAAMRRIARYARLPANDRATALAELSGFGRVSLAAAIHHPGLRGPHELRRTIALIESARRQILLKQKRPRHGKR